MTIVERIKSLQEKKDGRVSLDTLEKRLGLEASAISGWDKTPPPANLLQLAADYLATTPSYLLGETNDPLPPKQRAGQPPYIGFDAAFDSMQTGQQVPSHLLLEKFYALSPDDQEEIMHLIDRKLDQRPEAPAMKERRHRIPLTEIGKKASPPEITQDQRQALEHFMEEFDKKSNGHRPCNY